jgi:hypothetical protein
MITALEVLLFLCPGVEVTIYGQEYEGIIWHNGTPAITKKEFENGFKQLADFRAKEEAEKANAKLAAEAKLAALGLSADDLKALGL